MGDYSNFTQPDDQPPKDPADPMVGRTGVGAYRDYKGWGGRGDAWQSDGKGGYERVGGTSAFDEDIARDQQMGANVQQKGATVIQTGANQSRGIDMGALGMLHDRAAGGMTPAQEMAQRQAQGAVYGVQSTAAGVAGGAQARAAAAAGATALGARVQAQGAQDVQALRAREMADAAGQLYTASTAQRGNDLDNATAQAKLQAQQNALNENHDQFWQQQQYATQKAQADASLGRGAADIAATNAASATGLAHQNAAWQNYKDNASTALAGANGLASATTQSPAPAPQPAAQSSNPDDWHDYNSDTSDKRAKTAIRPVSDEAAKHLKSAAESMLAGYRSSLDAGPSVGGSAAEPPAPAYDGKYLGSPFPAQPDAISGADPRYGAPPSLDDAIASRVAQDNAAQPRYGYFDEADGGSKLRLGGNPGYAASRKGHAGYMFGPAPAAMHGFEGGPPKDAAHLARDREVMLSDDRTKLAAAWDQGHKAAFEDVQRLRMKPPEELKRLGEGGNKLANAIRGAKADAYDEARGGAKSYVEQPPMPAEAPPPPIEAPAAAAAPQPQAPPPAAEEPGFTDRVKQRWSRDLGYLDSAASRMRSMMPSDERTKQGAHGEHAMASALRSLAPSIYEYKPGYAGEAGQRVGEKNVGPMAQNMAADPLAATAIVTRPDGMLAIDKDKGLKLALGGLSSLQQQVDDMKKRKATR